MLQAFFFHGAYFTLQQRQLLRSAEPQTMDTGDAHAGEDKGEDRAEDENRTVRYKWSVRHWRY